jgi:exodeoxyribonuclease VII large subunit
VDLFDVPFEDDEEPPVDALREPPKPPRRHIYSVAELTAGIRTAIETAFDEIWVEGEISNCKVWNSGHMYFTLKDGSAQLKAMMFRSALRYLRFKPEDGLHVVARGRLGVYEPKGEYQLVCEHLEPHGLGALQLAFDQLKKRLQAEGLFETARKRPLPALPRRIGIVTSLDGAAIRDILKVLRRRAPNASVLIRPTRVQGEGAADDVARALKAIGRVRGVDVVIVGRGGGSIEDLWAFNEEVVARAIAASPVPVISAVGHEVDVTIADFIADLRAPTPSAAAEMVVAANNEFCGRIDRLTGRLRAAARADLQGRRAAVHLLSSRRGLAALPARLAMRGRHAAELTHHLRSAARSLIAQRGRDYRALRQRLEARDLPRRLAAIRSRLTAAEGRLTGAAQRAQHRSEMRFRALAGRLENLSPLAVLGRGYAVCWNADKTAIVRSAASVQPGEAVRVTLAEGELACRVERTEHRHPDDGEDNA